MAGPVGHIFLSLAILSTALKHLDKKEFMIGTILPDIRYITGDKREKTHLKNITMDQIKKEPSAFKAGFLFHSLVDELRDKYIRSEHIHTMLPKSKYAEFCLKFFEDQLIYKKIKNWPEIIRYFNTIPQEELAYEIPQKSIKKWHHFVKAYCGNQQTAKTILSLYFYCSYLYLPKILCNAIASAAYKLKLLPANVSEIIDVFEKIKSNEKIKKMMLKFYNNFETILSKYETKK